MTQYNNWLIFSEDPRIGTYILLRISSYYYIIVRYMYLRGVPRQTTETDFKHYIPTYNIPTMGLN